MHAPTLPSLPSWETPIAASRDIVEAIAGAADSAVDAATHAVRSARRSRRSSPTSLWLGITAIVVAGVAVFVVRSRRGHESAGSADRASGVTAAR